MTAAHHLIIAGDYDGELRLDLECSAPHGSPCRMNESPQLPTHTLEDGRVTRDGTTVGTVTASDGGWEALAISAHLMPESVSLGMHVTEQGALLAVLTVDRWQR